MCCCKGFQDSWQYYLYLCCSNMIVASTMSSISQFRNDAEMSSNIGLAKKHFSSATSRVDSNRDISIAIVLIVSSRNDSSTTGISCCCLPTVCKFSLLRFSQMLASALVHLLLHQTV